MLQLVTLDTARFYLTKNLPLSSKALFKATPQVTALTALSLLQASWEIHKPIKLLKLTALRCRNPMKMSEIAPRRSKRVNNGLST